MLNKIFDEDFKELKASEDFDKGVAYLYERKELRNARIDYGLVISFHLFY